MTGAFAFDLYLDRINRGDRLTAEEIRDLATTPDILSLGMLADTFRRRLHGTRVSFLRVAEIAFDRVGAESVPAAARELRLTGSPAGVQDAVSAIENAKTVSASRSVAGFSWVDVERWSAESSIKQVLARLKRAGLDRLSELPLDSIVDPGAALQSLTEAGFQRLCLAVATAPADARMALLLRMSELQDVHGIIQSINPLPMSLSTFRPTTGYEDVKMVALARLAAPNVPSIQVDWRRYGPKLAQVALTFGADDVDGVSASDDAPEGRRRAALPEIRRNIEAAGLSPVERDGWFNHL